MPDPVVLPTLFQIFNLYQKVSKGRNNKVKEKSY